MSFGRLALGVLACLALACSTPEERFAKHVERAEAHAEAGRPDDALIELQSALKLNPEDAGVNQRLGELLRDRGTHQAAAFHFGEAYRIDPQRIEAGLSQAELLVNTAPQRADQLIVQIRASHPDDARVLRSEARVAAELGDAERGLAAAIKGTQLAPNDAESWSQLGSSYIEQIRRQRRTSEESDPAWFESGLAALQKADDLAGGHVGARLERARLLGWWAGHEEQAAEAYRSAIQLADEKGGTSGVAFAAMRMSRYAARIGDAELRIEALRKILEVDPERVQVWEELARSVSWLDSPEAGKAVLKSLIESQPESVAAHTAYTNFLAQQGEDLDAIAHLDRVISEGVDAPVLWEQLILLEIHQRRMADARASLEEMKSRHGDAGATQRATARVAIHDGRYSDAVSALQSLGTDTNPETERLRAQAEMGAGNLDAARAAISRAMSGMPGDSATLRLRAAIEDEANDSEAVLASFEQLEKTGHELTAHERVMRARAHYATDRPDAGRAELVGVLEGQFPPPIAAVEFSRREGSAAPHVAHAFLQKTLRLAPGHYGALEAITDLELESNQAASALARLDKLVESQLAGPNVLLLRARILGAAGQLDRAEADALRAFEASPDLDGAVDVLYGIYAAQGKLEDALTSFEEADSVGVLHSGARVLLGRLYISKGQTEKAKAMYERVIEEDPAATTAKNDLAFLLASSGSDIDRALNLAEDAQRAKPKDPAIADTVGFVYLKKGRNEVALQQFRYAIELGESARVTSPGVHYHLGLALSALGRDTEAAVAFEKALAIDPSFHDAPDARRRIAKGSSESS